MNPKCMISPTTNSLFHTRIGMYEIDEDVGFMTGENPIVIAGIINL